MRQRSDNVNLSLAWFMTRGSVGRKAWSCRSLVGPRPIRVFALFANYSRTSATPVGHFDHHQRANRKRKDGRCSMHGSTDDHVLSFGEYQCFL